MARDRRVDFSGRRPREDLLREAPSRGRRTIAAILPNGRTVWLGLEPELAPAAAADQLAQQVERSERWRHAALASHSDAIARLARTLAADTGRQSEAQLTRAHAVRRRIIRGDVKVDRRLAKEATAYRARVAEQIRIEEESVRRLGRRDLWDQIVIATAAPLFAAYGQRGRPFGTNNLTLALALLVWIVGDEIVDALFGSAEKSPYALNDTDAWSYIAPIGNLLTGWWLLDDFQHERFVAGVTQMTLVDVAPDRAGGTLTYRYHARVPLDRRIGPSTFDDFRLFTGVPVVAAPAAIRFSADAVAVNARLSASGADVNLGRLALSLVIVADDPGGASPLALGSIDVAWIVDTAKPPETSISG